MCENELYHFGVKGMKWGHRKNYYGSSGETFRASNGLKVGAPKNAGVAAFRKAQGSRVGGGTLNAMAKMNTAFYGHGKNKETWKRLEARTRKENQAIRESNKAHKDAVKAEKKAYRQTDEYKAKRAKAVKVGAAVAGTALAAYGAYKVGKFVSNKKASNVEKIVSDSMKKNDPFKGLDDSISNLNRMHAAGGNKNFGSNKPLEPNPLVMQMRNAQKNVKDTPLRSPSELRKAGYKVLDEQSKGLKKRADAMERDGKRAKELASKAAKEHSEWLSSERGKSEMARMARERASEAKRLKSAYTKDIKKNAWYYRDMGMDTPSFDDWRKMRRKR